MIENKTITCNRKPICPFCHRAKIANAQGLAQAAIAHR